MSKRNPLKILDEHRGTTFLGEWPTIPELFELTVAHHGQRRAFTTFAPTLLELNYEELHSKVQQVAQKLHALGVQKGECVGLTGKNSPEWGVAYLGVLYAGAVVVPLDYGLKDEEIQGLMGIVNIRVLFCDEEKYDYFSKSKLKELISLSVQKENYIFDIGPQKNEEIELPKESDLAAILFTSGTTGVSKGVMLTHSNIVSDMLLAQYNMDVYPEDVFYALLPLHHSYAMTGVFILSIATGSEVVFGKAMIIDQILRDMKQGKVTMFLGVPLLFNKLIKGLMRGVKSKGPLVYGLVRFMMWKSGFIKRVFKINTGRWFFKGILAKVSLDNNRVCISGGGALPASTVKQFNQLGVDFVQGYGLTEASPILTLNPKEAYIESSVGKFFPQIEAKILDPDENGCGELVVKGPMVMKGYYNNSEATQEAFTEDGFLKTGDVGYIDKNNYLYLTGRAKSIIVTAGGKNVFPEEIEDKFQLFDEIEQICVRGFLLDKAMKEEAIEALIYPTQESQDLGEEHFKEIIDTVNRELKIYQKINRFHILTKPMPMTSTKKIQRREIPPFE